MSRLYSLSYMTLETSPPKMIEFAAEAGYNLAGIRMMPSLPGGQAFPLMSDPAMLRETLMRIDDTGVKVLDVEIARIDGVSGVELWLPMLEASAKVGARTIVVAGDDPDEARMTETYGLLCDAAAPFGLTINLEFTPWTTLNNAATASRIVTEAARPNGEMLIDLIHVARSKTTLADIRAIDPARMSYFQICDAPPGNSHEPGGTAVHRKAGAAVAGRGRRRCRRHHRSAARQPDRQCRGAESFQACGHGTDGVEQADAGNLPGIHGRI